MVNHASTYHAMKLHMVMSVISSKATNNMGQKETIFAAFERGDSVFRLHNEICDCGESYWTVNGKYNKCGAVRGVEVE